MRLFRALLGLVGLILLAAGCVTHHPPPPDASRASITTRETSLNHPRLPDRASLYIVSRRTFDHDPPPVTVTLNGDTVGTLGDNQYFRLALDPGTYRLGVGSCPGVYRCRTETLTLEAGDARHLKVRVVHRWGALAPVVALFQTVGKISFQHVPEADRDLLRNNMMVHPRRHGFRREMVR